MSATRSITPLSARSTSRTSRTIPAAAPGTRAERVATACCSTPSVETMTLSMTLLRGLEDGENAALLSPCHSQISVPLQLFWGKANAGRGRRCSALRRPVLRGRRPAAGVAASLRPPACDFGQLPFGPDRDRFKLAEMDPAAVAVDGNPVAGRNGGACELGPVRGHVDCEITAADHTGLAHLARDQRGMRG